MTVFIVIGAAVLIALLIADLMIYRLMIRGLFWLVDRLPPYRPGGRYRSGSAPEKYALLRRTRDGS